MLTIIHGYPKKIPNGLIFLPDGETVNRIAGMIAEERGAYLGARTFTPYTFIYEIAEGLDLPRRIGDDEAYFLFKNVIGDVEGFEGASDFPGLLDSLLSLMTSLGRAGIFSREDFLKKIGGKNKNHFAIAELIDKYRDALKNNGKADSPFIEFEAIKYMANRGLPKSGFGFKEAHALYFDDIQVVEADFFANLASHISLFFYSPCPDKLPIGKKYRESANYPATLVAEKARKIGVHVIFEKGEYEKSDCDDIIHVLSSIDGNIAEIPQSNIEGWRKLSFLSEMNSSAEADVVASAVKSLYRDSGIELNEIGIFVDSDSSSKICRALGEYGIPFDSGNSLNFADTVWCDLLRRILDLSRARFRRNELFLVLSHPFISPDIAQKLDNIAREAEMIGGYPIHETWLEPLKKKGINDSDKIYETIKKLADVFEASFSKRVDGAVFAQTIRAFIQNFDIKKKISKYIAVSDDIRLMKALDESFKKTIELLFFFDNVREDKFEGHLLHILKLLSKKSIPSSGGEGVAVLEKSRISKNDFRISIITNAIQGRLPEKGRIYPYLSRNDSIALGLEAPGNIYRKEYNVLSILTRSDLMILTRPEAEGDRPLPPAPIVLSMKSAMGESGWKSYLCEMKAITEKLFGRLYSASKCQIETGKKLRLHAEDGELGIIGGREILKSAHSLYVDALRRAGSAREYSANIGQRFENDLANVLQRIQATEVNSLWKCPMRFFLEKIVGISPIAEPEVIDEDKLFIGSVLHKALELFWRARLEPIFGDMPIEKRVELLKKDFDSISRKILKPDEVEEDKKEEIKPHFEEAFNEGAGEIANPIERDYYGYLISNALEQYAITLPDLKDGFVPIDTEKRLKINIEGIQISAKIDRIDANIDGKFRIMDYKSGKSPDDKDVKNLDDIQLHLYCVPFAEDENFIGGYFLKDMIGRKYLSDCRFEKKFSQDSQAKNSIEPDEWRAILSAVQRDVEDLLKRAMNGDFSPFLNKSCIRKCPYDSICYFDRSEIEMESEDDDGE